MFISQPNSGKDANMKYKNFLIGDDVLMLKEHVFGKVLEMLTIINM